MPKPEWLEDIDVRGTRVHTFLQNEFKSAAGAGLRWGGQEVQTIAREGFGRSVNRDIDGARDKPDLAEYVGGEISGKLYEIKRGFILAGISPLMFLLNAQIAEPQLRRYERLLETHTDHPWDRGTTAFSGLKSWPDFPYAPPKTKLVTFNMYFVEPGVILYDFVPEEEKIYEDIQTIAMASLLFTRMQFLGIRTQATAMASATRSFQTTRLKAQVPQYFMTASLLAAVGIGMADYYE